MAVTSRTRLLLAFRSGDRCAFPMCSHHLSVDGVVSGTAVIGEAAHIAGEHDGSARHDASMTDAERNAYPNLIYLCPLHHTQIDKQEADFSVDTLTKMKKEHERKVADAVAAALPQVRFEELEIATKGLVEQVPAEPSYDFSLTPPDAKLKINGLGQQSRYLVVWSLGRSREVHRYIEMVAQTDSKFPDRLKAGFLMEYNKLVHEGVEGDELFALMCRFAQRGLEVEAHKAAGLAILAYLFEACEVFQK